MNQTAELRRHGVCYPSSLRSGRVASHTRLVTAAADPHRIDDLRRWAHVTSPDQVPAHREAVTQGLAEELASWDPDVLLLSSEHCQSRLRSVAEVATLRRLLARFCDDITVVVYLRPQHEAALSLYSTRLKAGLPAGDPFSGEPAQPGFFDYGALVNRWASVFGQERVRVRIYEKGALAGGSVLEDFREVAGLPVPLQPPARPANPSLSPRGLRVLGAVNIVLPRFVLGRKNPVRAPVARAVERLFRGDGPVVGRTEAVRFYERFAATNEVVRRRFFPDRPTLFNPDFRIYD
ncbi:hypothetical protein [Myceligenerans pegani]|uniref:Uncharacterized protein n=1 Tax=Myceligenerans pegani TaxID=2776917 RepID=A0ABR9MVT5_9MICO|nr:hypothetical protein [Myceligenerans sp. TRM 65318]MBE1875230.1 hypothetical protein [Myceligenerans sp. TRM 65318]MBE3017501.1 hypothetical protein [Myceligenerans sp. TRM 65318]